MLSLVAEALVGPEAFDDLQALVRARPAFLHRNPHRREIGRVVPSDTDAEDHAPTGQHVQARDRLGDQDRVPERQDDDIADDPHVLGHRGKGRHQGGGFQDGSMPLDMVPDLYRVESQRLGLSRELDECLPPRDLP